MKTTKYAKIACRIWMRSGWQTGSRGRGESPYQVYPEIRKNIVQARAQLNIGSSLQGMHPVIAGFPEIEFTTCRGHISPYRFQVPELTDIGFAQQGQEV